MRVLGDWLLTPARAAIHLPTATAAIADLHLGYDDVRRRGGEAVPSIPLQRRLAPLAATMRLHATRRLVIAGDLLEHGRCPDVLVEFDAWLREEGLDLIAVVPGNHDRGFPDAPVSLPLAPDGIALGGWRVVHGDGLLPKGRVVHGHDHPCFSWRGTSSPCYVVGHGRLVLPAFSEDARGGNVLRMQKWADCQCCVVAGDSVLDFGAIGELRHRLHDA